MHLKRTLLERLASDCWSRGTRGRHRRVSSVLVMISRARLAEHYERSSRVAFSILACVPLLACAPRDAVATDARPDAACVSAPLTAEAGFLEIGTSRMFYSFHPADDCQLSRPVALLFNGGPGISTAPLMTLNTGPYTLASYDGVNSGLVANPSSWTRFANVLYVDARLAGFSYDLAPLGDYTWRGDTALFVRGLLQFLAAHPMLRANRVVLVGESYGGTRATRMLDLLFHYGTRAEGALAAEIQAHFDAVFGAAGELVAPDVIARQFGHQVLIQPLVLPNQGPICGYGQEDTSHSDDWLQNLLDSIQLTCTDVEQLRTLWGVDPRSIEQLLPEARGTATRDLDVLPPQGNLVDVLGSLRTGDAYFSIGGVRFDIDASELADHFVTNLMYVKTLITNARYDCAIVSSQIPRALMTTPGVSQVAVVDETIHVTYADPAIGERTIAFPSFDAGHMVSAYQPDQLSRAIARFIADE